VPLSHGDFVVKIFSVFFAPLPLRVFALSFLYSNHSSGTDICDAADIREPSAANASIQWHQPSFPPTQNVNSAASAECPASHFGGNYAKSAKLANFVVEVFQVLIFFDSLHRLRGRVGVGVQNQKRRPLERRFLCFNCIVFQPSPLCFGEKVG